MEIINSVKRSFSLLSSTRRTDSSALLPQERLRMMPRTMAKTRIKRLVSIPRLSRRAKQITKASATTVTSGGITRMNAKTTLQIANIAQSRPTRGNTPEQMTALPKDAKSASAKKNSLPNSKPKESKIRVHMKPTALNSKAWPNTTKNDHQRNVEKKPNI